MTSQDSLPSNTFAPPNELTRNTLLPPPEKYRDLQARDAAKIGVASLVENDPLVDLLSEIEADKVGGVRVPSYWDRYGVFTPEGTQLKDSAGAPLDFRTMGFIPGKRPNNAHYPHFTDVEGRTLVPVSAATQKRSLKGRIGTAVYNHMDSKYGFEARESHENAENQKIIQETVGTGPDEDERILFNSIMRNGVLQKYDGTPRTPSEIANYKRQLAVAKVNRARFQGLCAYEIGKREEQEQAAMWLQLVNFMHTELGYGQHDIIPVLVGLQYMKKASYLTFKHRGLELVSADGEKLDPHHASKEQLRGSYYRFGKIKERGYATELADKFKPYEMTFTSVDVAELFRLTKSAAGRIEGIRQEAEATNNPELMNGRAYQNAAYVLRKIRSAIDASRMGSPAEPGKEGLTPEQVYQQERLGAGGYAPRISGSAEANEIWKQTGRVVDLVASRNPVIKKVNIAEYESLSDQYAQDHEYDLFVS